MLWLAAVGQPTSAGLTREPASARLLHWLMAGGLGLSTGLPCDMITGFLQPPHRRL